MCADFDDHLYADIFEAAPEPVMVHDPETGRILDANRAACELVGRDRDQLVGAVVGDVTTATYTNEDAVAAFAQAVAEGDHRVTWDVVGPAGGQRPVDVTLSPLDVGGTVRVAAFIRERANASEERVDALSETTNDLLYTHTEAAVAERVTDIAQRIIDRPIAAMWSYDADADELYPIGATATATDFAGVDIAKDLPRMGPEADEKAIFDSGEPAVIEDYGDLDAPSAPGVPLGTMLCLPLDDHGLLCVGSTTVEPFDDSERHLLDILSSTATAALDRVSRETELESQRAALAASNEALQRRGEQMEFFNSILRHDILNGMTVIRARGEMLAAELSGHHREYAETIVEWSDDIVELTRKVRSVLQTLSEDDTAETKPVKLAPVIESAAHRAVSMAPGATVDVSVPDGVRVTADELLHDVFGNILTNAVEHGSTSGDGESDAQPSVAIEVTATVDEETVTVRVADDGPGIADSVTDSLFQRGGKSTDSSGTGFGLYFVDAMLETYGGEIRVEESESGGAAFIVELAKA